MKEAIQFFKIKSKMGQTEIKVVLNSIFLMIPQRKYCNHYGYLVWIVLILQGSCKRKTYTCTFLWFLLPSLKFHSFVKWEIESFKTTSYVQVYIIYCIVEK